MQMYAALSRKLSEEMGVRLTEREGGREFVEVEKMVKCKEEPRGQNCVTFRKLKSIKFGAVPIIVPMPPMLALA